VTSLFEQVAQDHAPPANAGRTVRFTVHGQAAPQGSKKAFYHKKLGRAILVDASPKTKPWKVQVAQVAGDAMDGRPLFLGPVAMIVVFHRPRPRSHFRMGGGCLTKAAPSRPTSKPDLLKTVRAVEDALTGVVYHDDAQVWCRLELKVFGEADKVEVLVTTGEIPIAELLGVLRSDPT
jgi:Holliday junction resolvase RusA-like endonuclease